MTSRSLGGGVDYAISQKGVSPPALSLFCVDVLEARYSLLNCQKSVKISM
jgi:O-acetyl-ADP-ribose deacetylase (regulator of RNase III)